MLRKGNWKLVNTISHYSPDNIALYDLSSDLGVINNLRESHPEKFKEMLKEWDMFAKEIRVQFSTPVAADL